MNKTYLCIFPLTLVLSACGGITVNDDGCISDTRRMVCKGDPRVPMVNLNTNSMKVSPRCVKANPGTTIVFRLTPKDQITFDTVEIVRKLTANPANAWLEGKNDIVDDLIIIQVPDKDEIELGDFDYKITTPDKCKDPRVRVLD